MPRLLEERGKSLEAFDIFSNMSKDSENFRKNLDIENRLKTLKEQMESSKLELYYLVYDYDTWLSIKQNMPSIIDHSNSNILKTHGYASCFGSTNKFENYQNNFHNSGYHYNDFYNRNYFYEGNINYENYKQPFHDPNGFTYDSYPLDYTRKIKEENDIFTENTAYSQCPSFQQYRQENVDENWTNMNVPYDNSTYYNGYNYYDNFYSQNQLYTPSIKYEDCFDNYSTSYYEKNDSMNEMNPIDFTNKVKKVKKTTPKRPTHPGCSTIKYNCKKTKKNNENCSKTDTNTERNYFCDFVGCRKAYKKKAHLTCHKRLHTGEKPFTCSLCFLKLRTTDELTRHVRKHTGERPYTCMICNKSFARSDHLSVHQSIHRSSAD